MIQDEGLGGHLLTTFEIKDPDRVFFVLRPPGNKLVSGRDGRVVHPLIGDNGKSWSHAIQVGVQNLQRWGH